MLLHGRGAEDDPLPVGIHRQAVEIRERSGDVVVASTLVDDLRELTRVQHGDRPRHLLNTDGALDVQAVLAAAPLPRGDEHHAVGATRPVDSGGGRVLENFHRLHVVRVHGGQRAASDGKAIDYVEGIVAADEGVPTADAHRRGGTRSAVVLDDQHTGGAALQRLVYAAERCALRLVRVDRGDRARQVAPPLRAVADGHDRLQLDRLRLELEVDHGVLALRHDNAAVGGGVPQHPGPHAERAGRYPRDGVAARAIGQRGERRADDAHSGARQWCARFHRGHRAPDRTRLLRLGAVRAHGHRRREHQRGHCGAVHEPTLRRDFASRSITR